MPSIIGAKLYVFAIFCAALAMRLTIGDAPFSAEDAETIGWVLNGVVAGLGVIVGPEAMEVGSVVANKMAGKGVKVVD